MKSVCVKGQPKYSKMHANQDNSTSKRRRLYLLMLFRAVHSVSHKQREHLLMNAILGGQLDLRSWQHQLSKWPPVSLRLFHAPHEYWNYVSEGLPLLEIQTLYYVAKLSEKSHANVSFRSQGPLCNPQKYTHTAFKMNLYALKRVRTICARVTVLIHIISISTPQQQWRPFVSYQLGWLLF